MEKTEVELENYAFVDAQNLHMAIDKMGWKIDYKRFRVYLREHYKVKKVYMFMGFKPDEQQMYSFLQDAGYNLIFKPILELKSGKVKGNCDAELVLQAMIDFKRYEKAIIVTGDGDFYCLLKYLQEQGKLETVLVPSAKNCSSLIKKILKGELTLVSDLKNKIEYKQPRKK
ncbi:NYN domain-containing protein [Candidatus Gracilibacteria bacterium]|nr:NYN domain-containing protein [Candidatus Gracilibacteria bacterium]